MCHILLNFRVSGMEPVSGSVLWHIIQQDKDSFSQLPHVVMWYVASSALISVYGSPGSCGHTALKPAYVTKVSSFSWPGVARHPCASLCLVWHRIVGGPGDNSRSEWTFLHHGQYHPSPQLPTPSPSGPARVALSDRNCSERAVSELLRSESLMPPNPSPTPGKWSLS